MRPIWISLNATTLKAAERRRISFRPRVRPGHRILDTGARFEAGCQHPSTHIMPLGSYSYSLSGFLPCASIGRYCSIGRSVGVFGDHHPLDRVSTSPVFFKKRKYLKKTGMEPNRDMIGYATAPRPVTIGNDVWIGDDVTLKDGVHVGDGAVIAACSVVTKDVSPYTIVGGNPAREIRLRFSTDIIDELLALKWWQFSIHAVQELPTENVEEFLREAQTLGDAEINPEARISLSDLID